MKFYIYIYIYEHKGISWLKNYYWKTMMEIIAMEGHAIHCKVSCNTLHLKHDQVIVVHTRSLMFQCLRSRRVLSMGARPHKSSNKTTPKLNTSLRSVNEFVCQYLQAWTHSKSLSWLPPLKKHNFLLGVMRLKLLEQPLTQNMDPYA